MFLGMVTSEKGLMVLWEGTHKGRPYGVGLRGYVGGEGVCWVGHG